MFVAAAFLAVSVQAQDLKISLNKKGKVGFVDSQGNVVVKCIYDSATPFEKGISIVTKSGKSGIIDASGKVLLPLKYTQIYPWANGLYLVKNGKKMGLAKSNGQIALDVKYSHISKINCYGKALVALGGKNATVEKKNYMANANTASSTTRDVCSWSRNTRASTSSHTTALKARYITKVSASSTATIS